MTTRKAAPRSIRLGAVSYQTGACTPLVDFTIREGKAIMAWHPGSESMRRDLQDGIPHADGLRFPEDGEAFLLAVIGEYSHRTCTYVQILDDGRPQIEQGSTEDGRSATRRQQPGSRYSAARKRGKNV